MTRRQTARLAGALYAAASLGFVINLIFFPTMFLVRGDAAATAARIVAAPLLYRLCVLGDLMAGVAWIYMGATFCQLFNDVDRTQARVLLALVFVQVPMYFAIALTQLAPLVLLNGAGYWSAFDRQQLEALALGFLGLRSQGIGAMSAYWGLWLLPLGLLAYRSGFIPRLLGIFLLVAGCSYLASAVTFFIFPAWYRIVFWSAAPLGGLGEIGIVGWLLIKGAREDGVRP